MLDDCDNPYFLDKSMHYDGMKHSLNEIFCVSVTIYIMMSKTEIMHQTTMGLYLSNTRLLYQIKCKNVDQSIGKVFQRNLGTLLVKILCLVWRCWFKNGYLVPSHECMFV